MNTQQIVTQSFLWFAQLKKIFIGFTILFLSTPQTNASPASDPVKGVYFPQAKIFAKIYDTEKLLWLYDDSTSPTGDIVKRTWFHNGKLISNDKSLEITLETGVHNIHLEVIDQFGKKRTAYYTRFVNLTVPPPRPIDDVVPSPVYGVKGGTIKGRFFPKDHHVRTQLRLEGGWGEANLSIFGDDSPTSLCNVDSNYNEYCIIENPTQFNKLSIEVTGVTDFGNMRLIVEDVADLPPPPPISPSVGINQNSNIEYTILEDTDEGRLIEFRNTFTPAPNMQSETYWNFGDGIISDESTSVHFFDHSGPAVVNLFNLSTSMRIFQDTLEIENTKDPILKNGSPITGLTDTKGNLRFFRINLPNNTQRLKVTIQGGTGDADLYVLKDQHPSTTQYDCRPYRWGNKETCNFYNPSSQVYYVMVRAYSDYSGVFLEARYY